jgi:hypothetical protein
MGLQSDGVQQLKLILKRMRDVPAVANEELRVCADKVQTLARNMAPIDYEDLRKSIRVRRIGVQGAGGTFMKGVSGFMVYVDNNYSVSAEEKAKRGVTKVGDYAWEVHEHMGWAGYKTELMPSKKSVADGLSHGVDAGGKFLERATDRLGPVINARLAAIIRKYVDMLDK